MGKGLNMQGLMRQAKKMQDDMLKAQEKLKDEKIEASVGGGMVKVVFSGNQELLKIEIDKEAVDPDDVETLEDLVLSAVNLGLKQSQEKAQDAMGGVTGGKGLNIPGLF